MTRIPALLLAVLLGFSAPDPARAELPEADRAALALLGDGRHFAMMRHALAPGGGDPPEFRLNDCTTQRNLSAEGLAQAGRIGAAFRAAGIAAAEVHTSQWCRCRDTATALDLGPVSDLPALNSFFANRQDGPAQTQALLDWLADADLTQPVVLVTHQVNITGLTRVVPASGETLVLRREADGSIAVAARIRVD